MDATIDYSTYTFDELIDENSYHIRLYARDGIIKTKNYILPSPIKGDINRCSLGVRSFTTI